MYKLLHHVNVIMEIAIQTSGNNSLTVTNVLFLDELNNFEMNYRQPCGTNSKEYVVNFTSGLIRIFLIFKSIQIYR